MGRNSAAAAAQTRQRIVDAAVARASSVGLEQVTVRDLAGDLGISKSGVAGPFGSRDELMAAAFDSAMATFRRGVIGPAMAVDEGQERIAVLIERWCDYLADCPFPGGCLMTTASVEFDNRPGRLRDRVVETVLAWREFLQAQVRAAYPELSADRCQAVVTTLIGISMSANQEIQLIGDATAGRRARSAMVAVLPGG